VKKAIPKIQGKLAAVASVSSSESSESSESSKSSEGSGGGGGGGVWQPRVYKLLIEGGGSTTLISVLEGEVSKKDAVSGIEGTEGGETTTFALRLLASSAIPIGGNDLTEDLAKGFSACLQLEGDGVEPEEIVGRLMNATEAYKVAMGKHANRKENTLFKCLKARTLLESERNTDAHTFGPFETSLHEAKKDADSLTHGPTFKFGNDSITPTIDEVFSSLIQASRKRVEGVERVRRMLGDRWQTPSVLCFGGGHFSTPLLRDMLTIQLYDKGLIGPPTASHADWMETAASAVSSRRGPKVERSSPCLLLEDTTKAVVALGGLLSHLGNMGETSVRVAQMAWTGVDPIVVHLVGVEMSALLPGDLFLRVRQGRSYKDELLMPAGSRMGFQRSFRFQVTRDVDKKITILLRLVLANGASLPALFHVPCPTDLEGDSLLTFTLISMKQITIDVAPACDCAEARKRLLPCGGGGGGGGGGSSSSSSEKDKEQECREPVVRMTKDGRFSCTWTEDQETTSVVPDRYRSSMDLSMNVFCEQRGKKGMEGVLATFEDLYPKRRRAVEIVESCRARLAIPADDPQEEEGDIKKMLDTLLKYGDYDTAPIPFRKISKRGAEAAMAKAAAAAAAAAAARDSGAATAAAFNMSPLCKTIMAAAAAGAGKRRGMETAAPVQLFPDNADANADADAAMAVVEGSLAERSSADGGDSSPPLAGQSPADKKRKRKPDAATDAAASKKTATRGGGGGGGGGGTAKGNKKN
jgi:hypothetical protein